MTLNSQACSHINSFLTNYRKDNFELVDLNIDKQIEQLDPRLWEAVCLLTRSVSEKRGVSKVSDSSSPAYHIKKVWRFFIACTMRFCINENYTIP